MFYRREPYIADATTVSHIGDSALAGDQYVEVKVRKDLYEKALKYIREVGGFDSVEELVDFLLTEILESETGGPAGYSSEDEEKVKERLRSLGYL